MLMRFAAGVVEKVTGKRAAISNSGRRATRYTGDFLVIARGIDRACAQRTGDKPLPESVLGSRLYELFPISRGAE
jgi:hypothetical protein